MRSAVKPLGVNISANVFGLSAHENLHIGQDPTKIGPLLDAISPMAYPSHYGPGEYNLSNPDSEPGATVTYTMGDFRAALSDSSKTVIRPWLQDFSEGQTYTLADVDGADQRRRARRLGRLAPVERGRRVPHGRPRRLIAALPGAATIGGRWPRCPSPSPRSTPSS